MELVADCNGHVLGAKCVIGQRCAAFLHKGSILHINGIQSKLENTCSCSSGNVEAKQIQEVVIIIEQYYLQLQQKGKLGILVKVICHLIILFPFLYIYISHTHFWIVYQFNNHVVYHISIFVHTLNLTFSFFEANTSFLKTCWLTLILRYRILQYIFCIIVL